MSFGFAVYRVDGTLKFSEQGGIATFGGVSAPNAPIPLHDIPPEWVWYAPVALIDREPVVTDYNVPSYLCRVQGNAIVFDFPSIYNPRIYWGIA